MPDTILIFGGEPKKKSEDMLLCHVFTLLVYGVLILRSATTFYKLPKLTLMFAKLKECPLPTNEFLLSRRIKKKKGTFLL